MPRIDPFPGCCGAKVLYLNCTKYSAEEGFALKRFLATHENRGNAFELCVLSKQVGQYGYKQELLDAGFEVVAEGAGQYADNDLMLLCRVRRKGEKYLKQKDDGKRTFPLKKRPRRAAARTATAR